MIAVISFIHDLLFHAAAAGEKSVLRTLPGTPNTNSLSPVSPHRALQYRARDANDVPGIGCARQRGFRYRCATFGLESAVKVGV
jgi:hypothetical protein